MEVITQKVIATPDDLLNLHIIDFARTNGYWPNPLAAIHNICAATTHLMACTIIEYDLQRAPDRADWPGWRHGWGEDGENSHTRLGRAYWNACRSLYHELVFSDEPDFEGYLLDGHQVAGDIGVVSASTFLMALGRMRVGDLWISVPDYKTQIILENQVNWPELIADGVIRGSLDPTFERYFISHSEALAARLGLKSRPRRNSAPLKQHGS